MLNSIGQWVHKHLGEGRPENIYLAALYISKKSRKNFFATRTFSIERDIHYIQVHVGYRCVFRCRRGGCVAPEVYEYGSWVSELLELAEAWHAWDARCQPFAE